MKEGRRRDGGRYGERERWKGGEKAEACMEEGN